MTKLLCKEIYGLTQGHNVKSEEASRELWPHLSTTHYDCRLLLCLAPSGLKHLLLLVILKKSRKWDLDIRHQQ